MRPLHVGRGKSAAKHLYAAAFGGDVVVVLLDFFLPAHCAACSAPGPDVCNRCVAVIAAAPAILRSSQGGAPPVTALGPYEGALRSTILALKFRGARAIGVRLGRWLAPKLLWPFEAVVPVPLHAARLRERGYNQAAEIARGISAAARVPCVEKALEKIRATDPQSALDLAERRTNVEGAFRAGPEMKRVVGLRVLLVDDVVTTGATASACSATLSAAGTRTLYLAAAAMRL